MDAILAFHSIDDSQSVLSFHPAQLERLLDGLLEEGVTFVPLAELAGGAGTGAAVAATLVASASPRVALTFDDGLRSVHAAVLPRLAARKLPFTVYVVTDWVGRDNRWPSQPSGIPRFELMGWSELAELQAAGAQIGGHTANHVHCKGLSDAEAVRELVASKRALEQRLGQPVTHFAYPYGTFDPPALARVRSTYESAVTTRLGYLPAMAARDRHRLPRLDSWYLREPARRLPLFAPRTRAWIAWRALLRRAKGAVYGA